MAEFVEQKLQAMVPEFEELERLGLLTAEEIKKLINRRRVFEYKMCKPKKEMLEFFDYIKYDTNLIELITARRKKLIMFKKLHKIEASISQRVIRRLRMMTHYWPGHPNVWKFRLSFAKARKYYDEVSTTFTQQIKFHGNDESVWVSWAQWEMEGRKNFDKARNILLSRAPLYHPKSIVIVKEYFRLELLFIENLKKKKSSSADVEECDNSTAESREKVLNCAVPEAIYKNAFKEFNSSELCLQFYWISHQFPFAHQLRDKILCDMIQTYPNDANVWKLRVTMMMKGICVEDNTHSDKEESSEESKTNSISENAKSVQTLVMSPKEKLMSLFELYDDALSSVGPSIFEHYIQDLFDILNQVWGAHEFLSIVMKKIIKLFEENQSILKPVHYLLWFKIASEDKLNKEKLKSILELGRSKYPNCQHYQLYLLPLSNRNAKLKNDQEIIKSLAGNIGAEICSELLSRTKGKKLRNFIIENACNHTDSTLSKTMRIKYLDSLTNLDDLRSYYRKYCSLPPFDARLHCSFLKLELKQSSLSPSEIRLAFDKAIEQFGCSQIGLWLSYIEFERKFGNQKKALHLQEEVLKKLDTKYKQEFIDSKIYLESILSNERTEKNSVLVDCPEVMKNESKYQFWKQSSLPNLFAEELTITYSMEQHKRSFFESLAAFGKQFEEVKEESQDKIWDEILSLILGENISLKFKEVDICEEAINKEVDLMTEITELSSKGSIYKKNVHLSDIMPSNTSIVSEETKKILRSSETLQPEFANQKQLIPYYLSKRYIKEKSKKLMSKDKGKGWFNMKAPEITEEVKRDIEILKMRSILDPHRHYKRNDMKEVPKYFQIGKVVDSPVDFYSSRVPKKERKRTFAEEIMKDEDVLRYQKRKFSEIVEKNTLKRKRMMKSKEGKRKRKIQRKVSEDNLA